MFTEPLLFCRHGLEFLSKRWCRALSSVRIITLREPKLIRVSYVEAADRRTGVRLRWAEPSPAFIRRPSSIHRWRTRSDHPSHLPNLTRAVDGTPPPHFLRTSSILDFNIACMRSLQLHVFRCPAVLVYVVHAWQLHKSAFISDEIRFRNFPPEALNQWIAACTSLHPFASIAMSHRGSRTISVLIPFSLQTHLDFWAGVRNRFRSELMNASVI